VAGLGKYARHALFGIDSLLSEYLLVRRGPR
jgi:hypothetical protein